MLTIAYHMGITGIYFITLICIFASPCAVSSYAMAQQMGSDHELAGASVIFTSAFSAVTLFGWLFLFKMLGAF